MGRLPTAWDLTAADVNGVLFGAVADFTWQLKDDALILIPVSGTAVTIMLGTLSVAELASRIENVPGFFVRTPISAKVQAASALTLLEGNGGVTGAAGYSFPSRPNADTVAVTGSVTWASSGYPFQTLRLFTNPNWALMSIFRSELEIAGSSVQDAPKQMCVPTAEGAWLDYLGSIFGGITRATGETDGLYGPRIISTILRPACNNKAIELAILNYTGQSSQVKDATNNAGEFNTYNGNNTHNGGIYYDSQPNIPQYGLFDLSVNYDQSSVFLTPTEFNAALLSLVSSLRAAGTYLRNFVVDPVSSEYEDSDVVTSDGVTALEYTWDTQFNGVRRYDGSVTYLGDGRTNETLE